MDDIFLELKPAPDKPRDINYTIYFADILYSHKWLECKVCGKTKIIKKGFSFVRVMKRLGWIYKPDPKRSRKKWQQKMWQCPDCQKKINLDDFLAKRERTSELCREDSFRKLTAEEEHEYYELSKELAKLSALGAFHYELRFCRK